MQIADLSRRLTGAALIAIEIAILSAIILATRFGNYQDVFVGGNIYFTDADCYARMTRVRMCSEHPGLIVRHHDFENFPQGTNPHTTAPLDYFILGLSMLLQPLTEHAIDLAGALISPLFALIGGWFLWWWSRRMRFCYRWAMLILYATSPILVHGTELGRPDHQSVLMLLVSMAICAEWTLRTEAGDPPSPAFGAAGTPAHTAPWSVASGIAWGLAIWVSLFEPLILLALIIVVGLISRQQNAPHSGTTTTFGRHRRIGWILFAVIVAIAFAVERRIPSLSIFHSGEVFKNWSHTIGELLPVAPWNPVWFRWAGYSIAVVPLLIWSGFRNRIQPPAFILVLIIVTYFLTIWQARWAYFFMSIFVIALPKLLGPIKLRVAVWLAFGLSIFPILGDWDERIWPDQAELARRVEHRNESMQLRDSAISLESSEVRPVLAPWWLTPSMSYWSKQPGVAGSSHESLLGIADTARFYLAGNPQQAKEILTNHDVAWVLAYDSDRVAQNSAALLGVPVPGNPLCRLIDRTPAQAPRYWIFSAQNGAGKLFQVANNR